MRVGKERIFAKDIDAILYTYYHTATTSPGMLEPALVHIRDRVVRDSILLQEAVRLDLATVSAKVYDNVNKDIVLRNQLVETLIEKIKLKYTDTVTGESITIWFHNESFPEPEMGYKKAQEFAKQKMDPIYADLKSGKISMREAAVRIQRDKSLADIDPNYGGNAYFRFADRSKENPPFVKDQTNNVVWTLAKGQPSDILTIRNTDKNGEYDAYYQVIRLNDRNISEFANFDAWYASRKGAYEVTYY